MGIHKEEGRKVMYNVKINLVIIYEYNSTETFRIGIGSVGHTILLEKKEHNNQNKILNKSIPE